MEGFAEEMLIRIDQIRGDGVRRKGTWVGGTAQAEVRQQESPYSRKGELSGMACGVCTWEEVKGGQELRT